jgi:hypothetical protein
MIEQPIVKGDSYAKEYPLCASMLMSYTKGAGLKIDTCGTCKVLYILHTGYSVEGQCSICSGAMKRYQKVKTGRKRGRRKNGEA